MAAPSLSKIKQLLPADLRDRYRAQWRGLGYTVRNAAGRVVRLVHRPARPAAQHGTNLHLGCGAIDHPAFINVDGAYFPHVHHVRRLDDLAPFKDGSVDFLYASHCLEHFEYGDTPAVLREWCRVVRPGGTARISVPDFDTLVEAYVQGGRSVEDIEVFLLGGHGNKYNYHVALFNEARLSSLLIAAGFSSVRKWQPGQDEFATMPDASTLMIEVGGKEVPLSLNLEAVK